MKKLLHSFITACILLLAVSGRAQCGAGYTQAQLNWDNLDYFWNSAGSAPYVNYITDPFAMTQKFAIGKNYITIALSSNNMLSPGAGNSAENTLHTGDVAGYTGADVQYTPSGGGQTITLTFNTEVYNLGFTLYDIDASQVIGLGAKDASNNAQSITVSTYGVTSLVLTPLGGVGTAPTITGGLTNLANTSNAGTATITVAGPVKTFTITVTTVGTDASFWLSDINACVLGSFPSNYNQTPDNRPLQGPAGNQPDYFFITPDNKSVYLVDVSTGAATLVFTDASNTYVNSFGYDPYHHILYYVTDGSSAINAPNNKTLKKYDLSTNTISTVVANIGTTLGIATFDQGVESAGAAFYDGALYLGIEGGRNGTGASTKTRETIVWRIDFDASLNPTGAYQVCGADAYKNGTDTTLHDYGDFIIKNGVLYDFNTARFGSSPGDFRKSSYGHYDMTTGQSTTYMNQFLNSTYTTPFSGQAGMDWAGNLYTFFSQGIAKYNENGTTGPVTTITLNGGAFVVGNGDGSENVRPQVDFGDAPASYDPNPLSPASHAQVANLRLGAGQDKEWITKGQTALANSDGFDDGLPTVQIFNPLYVNYLAQVSVFNNTGSSVTLGGWLDYDGNGVFDASEGVTVSVPSSASTQSVYLYWPYTPSSLPMGSYTYLRIRVTSKAMTTANATGYYSDGEVEDYRVPVNTFPLAVQQTDFNAQLTSTNSVKLNWSSADETNIAYYSVEKSINGKDWELVHFESAKHSSGVVTYETSDPAPFDGTSYYRLRITEKDGKMYLSDTKKIEINTNKFSLMVAPNPATTHSYVYINSDNAVASTATLEVINAQGLIVHKEKVRVNPGTNSISLPINTKFTNGRYVVRVTTNDKTYTQSLIINK